MKIDKQGTRERFRGSGRSYMAWAAAKGHNGGTLRQLINGNLKPPRDLDNTLTGKIIRDLEADGLLVTQGEDGTEEIAA